MCLYYGCILPQVCRMKLISQSGSNKKKTPRRAIWCTCPRKSTGTTRRNKNGLRTFLIYFEALVLVPQFTSHSCASGFDDVADKRQLVESRRWAMIWSGTSHRPADPAHDLSVATIDHVICHFQGIPSLTTSSITTCRSFQKVCLYADSRYSLLY